MPLSGRRAVRPDGGVYRQMRRQRLSRLGVGAPLLRRPRRPRLLAVAAASVALVLVVWFVWIRGR
jgi:hypothetical protein